MRLAPFLPHLFPQTLIYTATIYYITYGCCRGDAWRHFHVFFKQYKYSYITGS